MTAREIEHKFDRMQLKYLGTSEPRKFGLRAHRGYWTIPNESYQFRLVAIEPRNNWAIEIMTKSFGTHLLSAEKGIEFIQNTICDKFERTYTLTSIEGWLIKRALFENYKGKRYDFLIKNNLYTGHGKNIINTRR